MNSSPTKIKLNLVLDFDQSIDAYLKEHYSEYPYRQVINTSLDARRAPLGRKPKRQLEVLLSDHPIASDTELPRPPLSQLSWSKPPVVIVGAGPAGLFCALELVDQGVPCIVVERGAPVAQRMLSISKYWKEGQLDPDSNVCFGEGGAGLYSDGKLVTRVKSPIVKEVMARFVNFGAPASILSESNPHLGSNKIRQLIGQLTAYLQQRGCQLIYQDPLEEIFWAEGQQLQSVRLRSSRVILTSHVVLAAGHSARDMYELLERHQVAMVPKDFAVGVRLEHRRELIDLWQHGPFCGHPMLGAARYRLSHHNPHTDRGTYSFCMCPGGYVLSSASTPGTIVTNGMSNAACNSPWSNAAMVVSVKAGVDFPHTRGQPLAGLRWIESLERRAFEVAQSLGKSKELPACSLSDFQQGHLSSEVLSSSSPSKVFAYPLWELLPVFVVDHLREAFSAFEKLFPGFCREGLLMAPETRTSAPVKVLRSDLSLESVSHRGLYPCGEGAGHAGGITSAAVDGIKVARAILNSD